MQGILANHIAMRKLAIAANFVGGLDYLQKSNDNGLKKSNGEGTKGGKIVGHTKSGKPIYDKFSHSAHANFTREDHRDAAGIHRQSIDDLKKKHNVKTAGDSEKAGVEFNKKYKHHANEEGKHLYASPKPKQQKDIKERVRSDISKLTRKIAREDGFGNYGD